MVAYFNISTTSNMILFIVFLLVISDFVTLVIIIKAKATRNDKSILSFDF